MNNYELSGAIASVFSVVFPIFVMAIVFSNLTKSFYRGWNSTGGDFEEKNVYYSSRRWLLIMVAFVFSLFAGALYFIFRNPPIYFIGGMGVLVALAFSFVTIAFFRMRLEIGNGELRYISLFSDKKIPSVDIVDIQCAAGNLIVTGNGGRRMVIPLVFSNLADLGFNLKKLII